MIMENFKSKLDKIINDAFDILRNNNSGSRLIFPSYSNEKRRVSEQELRFVFVEQLQKLIEEYDFFYSVETPTKDKYKFSENGKKIVPQISEEGQSASFDLSIIDKNRNTIAIFEFKAKNANPHEYAKDFCKLWNPVEKSSYKYFLNLFEKIDEGTKHSFLEKLNPKTNKWLHEKESSEMIMVIAQSLCADDPHISETI